MAPEEQDALIASGWHPGPGAYSDRALQVRYARRDRDFWKARAEAAEAEVQRLTEGLRDLCDAIHDQRPCVGTLVGGRLGGPGVRADAGAVVSTLEQLRKERDGLLKAADGMARAPYGEYAKAHERAEAAEAEVQRLREGLREIRRDCASRWTMDKIDALLTGREGM